MPFAFALVLAAAAGAACASSKATPAASSPTVSPDAGADTTDAAATNEPPFAETVADATQMIAAAVDAKGHEVGGCVHEFRARKKIARDRVSVTFGIDQEGKLLGVTSRGKEDAELKACVQRVLEGARFPRSRAGVISVTKTYEERLQ
jgi:hypothetical protein